MDDSDYEKLLAQVVRLERRWLDLYCDPASNLIVAADPPGEQVSTDRKRMTLLESRLRRVASDLEVILPEVGRLDAVRQRVLIHMTFNMGIRGLLAMLRFVSAVEFRLWDTATDEMLISQWAKQEPRRANVLAAMMRTGRDDVLRVIQPEAHNQQQVQLGIRT